jgi:hypothetical protein
MTPRLQRWLDAGAIRAHEASRQEVADLLAIADRDLTDAGLIQLSSDRRFATAYGAALQLATIAVAASGLRVGAQRGHHALTWQVLPELMGSEMSAAAAYFDSCRALRNRGDHDRAGVVSAADVDEIIQETTAFRRVVLDWLADAHPGLAP